jgi:indolepyruvate ferredoxin oxidoreductase
LIEVLAPRPPAVIADRYEVADGGVFLSGVQALVRLPLEQMRRDKLAGLNSRAFITGYPGSPLGGYDVALGRAGAQLAQHGVTHLPGQNEELAATALMGTQMLDTHAHPGIDGVVGYWYGKGPGVDRASDAFKHGNFAGTSTHGAVVILSGEDHEAKSSTVPYQQEFAFEHFGVPVLYPATVSEFLTFGLHAAALSRYSGCWVALKLVGPLCDGGERVDQTASQPSIVVPSLVIDGIPFRKATDFTFFPVLTVATERRLYMERHLAVAAYARANALDRIMLSSARDRIGIVAAGKSYTDTRQALLDLGLDDAKLSAAGVRVGKIGLLAPADSEFLRTFARGLQRIIVVEEKRDFLERQIGRAACELGPIEITGKFDRQGRPLFPIAGGMDADVVAEGLARELRPLIGLPESGEARLRTIAAARAFTVPTLARRTPNYCSGCPHNVSTKLAPGQMAWGAPGCHVFAALIEQPERRIEALTQLGGEGMPWIGLSPYTSQKHIVQNVGDGSLFHSSYQNIRFAVAAGVNMTFRILFNGVVANTGGQAPVSNASVPTLLAKLALDGVVRIVLIAREPELYKAHTLPAIAMIRSAHEVQSSMAELAAIPGVTVLLYDGECANERRRRQKRGTVPAPVRFTVVNEDACENCGDCGAKANCMSLQKVDTEFGPKTQIHQSSCNQDQACIEGECPSFVTVQVAPGTGVRRPPFPDFADALPEPDEPPLDRPFHIYIPGVGGSGVITANAILAQAATLDGKEVKSYDQTGAAQKWGAVLSSLIVARAGDQIVSNKVGIGRADLYLALDAMAGADRQNLLCCDPTKTIAVISSDVLPSGEMIRNINVKIEPESLIAAIRDRTHAARHVVLAAGGIAERLFGDFMMANMVAIGAAYQAGHLPISAASIEAAIRLNGTQEQANITAFRAGRLSQHAPERLARQLARPYATLADHLETVMRRATTPQRAAVLLAECPALGSETRRLLEVRAVDLVDYQSERYARRFVAKVAAFAAAEHAALPGGDERLTRLVIRNLYKLMAYKDEYETARLLTDPVFAKRLRELFPGYRNMMFNLQPPIMRAGGLKKKIALGPAFVVPLRLLARLKFVRGSFADPFARAPTRKAERAAIGWYLSLIEMAQKRLRPETATLVADLLSVPDAVRGYEHLKLTTLESANQKAAALALRLDSATSDVPRART